MSTTPGTPDFESMQKEIEELKRQNEMLKKKKSNKMVVNQSKKSADPQQNRQFEMVPEKAEKTEIESIAKPTGNYTNIAEVLKLNNEEFNGYKANIRDLIEAYINIETPWENQDKRAILKIVERFKANNNLFPKTTGDWAIKELIRRSINNKRAHKKRQNKKETEVSSKKNKAVVPRDKNKVVASSSKTAENLSDDKSDNNDDNVDVDVDNTNTSRNKKNERKKSGRISNQSRKDYNENKRR